MLNIPFFLSSHAYETLIKHTTAIYLHDENKNKVDACVSHN